jgi:microcystin-dependent protein
LTLTLPAADGSSGQALTTNGSGALAFATIGGVPTGAVFYFAANTAPTGFLKANGAAVSRTTYAALFAITGTTYGSGDGSTTFNVPDLRGEFIRGWADDRAVDTGRAFGSAQGADTNLLSHTHSTTVTGYAQTGTGVAGGITYGAGFTERNDDGSISPNPNTASLTYTTGGPSPAGGAETRPRNVALLACIKF